MPLIKAKQGNKKTLKPITKIPTVLGKQSIDNVDQKTQETSTSVEKLKIIITNEPGVAAVDKDKRDSISIEKNNGNCKSTLSTDSSAILNESGPRVKNISLERVDKAIVVESLVSTLKEFNNKSNPCENSGLTECFSQNINSIGALNAKKSLEKIVDETGETKKNSTDQSNKLSVFKWFEDPGSMDIEELIQSSSNKNIAMGISPVAASIRNSTDLFTSKALSDKNFNTIGNKFSDHESLDSFINGIEEGNILDLFSSTSNTITTVNEITNDVLKKSRLAKQNPKMFASTVNGIGIKTGPSLAQVDRFTGNYNSLKFTALDSENEMEKTVENSSTVETSKESCGKFFDKKKIIDQSFDIESVIDDSTLFDDFNVGNFRAVNK